MEINSLVEMIKEDLERSGSYDRYPVRFFSMKYERGTSESLIQLRHRLDGVEFFDIRNLLPHEDAWITTDRFVSALQELDCRKSYMVVGFSEYARFLSEDEFISLLISLLEIENKAEKTKRRIYIPCFALYSQIKKKVKKYHRRFDAYNPFLNDTEVEDLPKIYFISDEIQFEDQRNIVVNSAEWFGMWRNPEIDPQIPILCMSKTLFYFYSNASPDNVYNIKQIKTYKEYLGCRYKVSGLRDYKKDPDAFYKRLLGVVQRAQGKPLWEMVLAELNVQTIAASDIYMIWKSENMFQNWLIQNYILKNIAGESYLYQMMDASEKLTKAEFVECTYKCIFASRSAASNEERRKILESVRRADGDIALSQEIIGYYNQLFCDCVRRRTTLSVGEIDLTKDEETLSEKRDTIREGLKAEFIPFLTCSSRYERKLMIWMYRQGLMTDEEIKDQYPALWAYKNYVDVNSYSETECGKFDDYFKMYRNCRLNLESRETYDRILSDWNGDGNTFYRWYYDNALEFPEVILRKKSFSGTVYVLDGVSAEFTGYIYYLLSGLGYAAEEICYGKSHLPSTTSAAQTFYPETYKWDLTYDKKVVHEGLYYHVDNLEKALTVVGQMVAKIASVQQDETFAVIADHGATAGHKIQKKEKKYQFEQADHDGRCWHNKERRHVEPSPDYIIYDDEAGEEWVIALNQQSLYNNSRYEVHGGATPEEVLVPVIIARKGARSERTYMLRTVNLHVSGLDKVIEVKITPRPEEGAVRLMAKDGTDTEMFFDEETNTWKGRLNRGIEQDIRITAGQQSFDFRTIPSTRMGMEDDLFDD